jgi:dTDP-4-dehydrorhamnose reductase
VKFDPSTRVYIAGCGGMLGAAVYAELSRHAQVKATDIDVNESWLSRADVRNLAEMSASIGDFKPHAIINLAAITDLEVCEREQENAWLTNALGAENLGLIANRLDVPYVYISTAGIFDGKQDVYTDFDAPNPLGYYAKSKAYGEAWVRQSVRKHLVLRAGWMMGGGPKKDKKFINKIYKQLKAGKKELFVVTDKLGTPTYTVDFARGIRLLLESEDYGLYNQVCGGAGSRCDVARVFVDLLGLHDAVKITEVGSDHFREEYFAPRPVSEKLVNVKLKARGFSHMREWQDALADYAGVYRQDMKEWA